MTRAQAKWAESLPVFFSSFENEPGQWVVIAVEDHNGFLKSFDDLTALREWVNKLGVA